MVFSSLVFLSVFLPVVLLIYPVLWRNSFRNYFLLIASLFFYAWGEPRHILVMICVIIVTYLGGQAIKRAGGRSSRMVATGVAIGLDIAVLLYYKYATFFLTALGGLLGRKFAFGEIALPIGVSFYVFQCVSYLVDVYRRKTEPQNNLFSLALYISMFPQLIAGPIVRYASIAEELKKRAVSLSGYAEGLTRFSFGLAKKVLLANQFGAVADMAFNTGRDGLTMPLCWLGAVCYALQIYFDFSGYSDMAIGLGRVFGFTFPENFNYPYISRSLTEFWRRWHMSLSSWFKDYLYIPLGGNRKGSLRTAFNMLLVFTLCGFWHGAAYNFILWGLWHGAFLAAEKRLGFHKKEGGRWLKALLWGYCSLAVLVGWVLFRADNIHKALAYVSAMFSFARLRLDMVFLSQMNLKLLLLMAVAIPVAFGFLKGLTESKFRYALALICLCLSYITLVNSSYNPFLYFRF